MAKPAPNLLLRHERERRNWTQEQVAERVGTTAFNVSRWERGKTFPGPHYRGKLCELFGKTAEELGLVRNGTNPGSSSETASLPPVDTAHQPTSSEKEFNAPHCASYSHRSGNFGASKRRLLLPLLFIVFFCLLLAIGGYFLSNRYFSGGSPRVVLYVSAHIKPGGSWISPKDGQIVHNILHFAAFAYPTQAGDPPIDHVNFTMWWQGVDPRVWKIPCALRMSTAKDVYMCDIDLAQMGVPAGQIRISFDVYDKMGNKNLSPNGEHTVTYVPSP